MPERRYETVLIVDPQAGEVGTKDVVARLRRALEEQGATIEQVDEWGSRELAYRIRKQRRGYYVLFQFRSTPQALLEFERNLKLAPEVMRFISVRQPEGAPRAAAEKKPAPAEPASAESTETSLEGGQGT